MYRFYTRRECWRRISKNFKEVSVSNKSEAKKKPVYTGLNSQQTGQKTRERLPVSSLANYGFRDLLNIFSQCKHSRIDPSPFFSLQILSSELRQPESTSPSLSEAADSPARTNIRCRCAHMGTITFPASLSISPVDSAQDVPESWMFSRTSFSLMQCDGWSLSQTAFS